MLRPLLSTNEPADPRPDESTRPAPDATNSAATVGDPPPASGPSRDHSRENSREKSPQRDPLGPRRSAAIVALWFTFVATLLAALVVTEGPPIIGDISGLVPLEHRLVEPELWLLLRERAPRPGDDADDAKQRARDEEGTAIERAAVALAEQLDELRVPQAPPASDAAVWLDTHRLYLVPEQSREALATRFREDATRRAVAGVRARLSSPLYATSGEQPRRDPLQLRELMGTRPGELGFLEVRPDDAARSRVVSSTLGFESTTDAPPESSPRITVAGDLITRDRRALLMRFRVPSDADALARLERALRSRLAAEPIDYALIGHARREASARASVRARAPSLLLTAVALLALLLSLTLRSVRAVAGVLLCLAGGLLSVLVLVALAPAPLAALAPVSAGVGLLDISLLIFTLGFACEGALHLPRISTRGWPAALIMATALAPLALSPYPAWRAWALLWAVGILVSALGLRLALPAFLQLTRRGSLAWPRPGAGFTLRPTPLLGLLLCAATLGGAAWSMGQLDFRGGHPLPTADARLRADESRMTSAFFDPTRLLEVRSRGATPEEALERAALRARELPPLLAEHGLIARVDSPGSLVAPAPMIAARREFLEQLGLGDALDRLEQELEASGMRPAAFSEFLDAARAYEQPPSAAAALAGPLGPWILSYLGEREPGEFELRARLHLRPQDASAAATAAALPDDIYGPALAVREDRRGFDDQLGLLTAGGLWLGALWVWIGTRRLSTAAAAALASLSAQSCLIVSLMLLGRPVGPYMLPAFLLVGAAAMIAGGRACQAIDAGRPFPAKGLLLTSACQIAAGLALLMSPEPLWRSTGLVLACGCALASGFGMFVAPGVCAILRGLAARGDDNNMSEKTQNKPAGPRPGDDAAGGDA